MRLQRGTVIGAFAVAIARAHFVPVSSHCFFCLARTEAIESNVRLFKSLSLWCLSIGHSTRPTRDRLRSVPNRGELRKREMGA